jgi:hypothetical protein
MSTITADLARRQDRYVTDVVTMHSRLSLRGLADQVDPDSVLWRSRGPDGVLTLAVRHAGIPQRYLLGIYGFRLAQYLRLRYASAQVAFDQALFAEPPGPDAPEVHLLALDEASGVILRYSSLVGSRDRVPRRPADPHRAPFPCEVAHRINLFEHVPCADDVRTDQVWEVKRLVSQAAPTGVAARLRLTLEMTRCFYRALERLDPPVRYLIGDGEEGVAITRLLRSLRDVTVLEGTTPSLPAQDLMFPAYTERSVVKAFVAGVPVGERLRELIGRLERAMRHTDSLAGMREFMGRAGGRPRRVQV